MGDMADFIMSNAMEDPEFQFYGGNNTRVLKQCRFCGTKELHWGVVGSKGEEKWRLHDKDNNEHYCMGGVVVIRELLNKKRDKHGINKKRI
jgi:hypothetical protein